MPKSLTPLLDRLLVLNIFLLGLWLIVIKPLGPNFASLPGDLGDTRLNNYLLEHFYRWILGLDKSFWSAPFWYPYAHTVAFSDNFLGSGFSYALFRWAGLDRESAFQGWYVLGFCLNYFVAAWVLSRFNLHPLAVGAGAFLFTFGLPVLAQSGHSQLLYRFGVPLAFYALWNFAESPKLPTLLVSIFFTVWQFYLSIYTGVFLSLLIIIFSVLLPVFKPSRLISEYLFFWPRQMIQAWRQASLIERLISLVMILLFVTGLGFLLWPYHQAASLFGFTRSWDEVATMLPRWQSYLLSDGSLIWAPYSGKITGFPMRWEHQLFPGLIGIILALIGILWGRKSENSRIISLNFGLLLALVTFTISIRGNSLYYFIYQLPGLNSLRAVTRIILIIMWPLAVLSAFGVDMLLRQGNRQKFILNGLAIILVGLLIAEPASLNQGVFNKVSSQNRLEEIRKQIPSKIPAQPILFVANNTGDTWWETELDGMLLAQELGWPTLNGYSGNFPPRLGTVTSCESLPARISSYMFFNNKTSNSFYLDMMARAVPVGFKNCDLRWWSQNPYSSYFGPFPQELFINLGLKIFSLTTAKGNIVASVQINNNSYFNLPSDSSTGNKFRLSWRFVDSASLQTLSPFETRQDLNVDIPSKGDNTIKIKAAPPAQPGRYLLEVTAIQEGVAWFYDKGVPIARSTQEIVIDSQNHILIQNVPAQ